MSNPRGFFNKKEANTGTEKTAGDVTEATDKIITREEYERQLEEAKEMAFGI